MNFFDFDTRNKTILVSDDLWIYFVALAILTGVTLLLWRSWMKRASKAEKPDKDHAGDEKV